MALALFLAVAVGSATGARADDHVVLQLHGPPQFEFAGYYAALWRGFFKEAGLDVDIRPVAKGAGSGPLDPAREVAEGRAQFGTGNTDIVVRIAQGQPLLVLAPIFQDSGAAVYYRQDSYISSPAALARVRVARLPASSMLDIELIATLKAEGVDPGQLNSVPIEPGKVISALADRTVDAAPGWAWNTPWQAREKGLTLRSLNLGDYRVGFYGDLLFTGRRFEESSPDTVRRFRAATLKGWDYAFQHADELVSRIIAEPGGPAVGDPGGFARYQAETARRLAHYPEVSLGTSDNARWKRIEDALVAAGALTRVADPATFIYDPVSGTRPAGMPRSFALLGGALLAALVLALLLWRFARQRKRRSAFTPSPIVPASAGANAETSPEVSAPAPVIEPPAPQDFAAILAAAIEPGSEPDRGAPAAVEEPPLPLVPASPPGPASIDLNPILSRYERTLRQRLPSRVEFRLSLLPELWRCRTDARVLRKVVLDLAMAAAAELPQGGTMIIGTRNATFTEDQLPDYPGAAVGEFARVTVRDNGAGMSDEALGLVFQTRPAVAAAQQAIERLGGFVRVESAEGVGTAVHLYFPRVEESSAARRAEAAQ